MISLVDLAALSIANVGAAFSGEGGDVAANSFFTFAPRRDRTGSSAERAPHCNRSEREKHSGSRDVLA